MVELKLSTRVLGLLAALGNKAILKIAIGLASGISQNQCKSGPQRSRLLLFLGMILN